MFTVIHDNILISVLNDVVDDKGTFVVPDYIVEIKSAAFQFCRGLTSIRIPISVKKIGVGAFRNCAELETAVIEGDIGNIPHGCFCGCKNLRLVDILNNVESIGSEAFEGCESLNSLFLPNINTVKISPTAFVDCKPNFEQSCIFSNDPTLQRFGPPKMLSPKFEQSSKLSNDPTLQKFGPPKMLSPMPHKFNEDEER